MKLNAVVIILLVFSSCQSKVKREMADSEAQHAGSIAESSVENQTIRAVKNFPQNVSAVNVDRKLIKSGSISLETDDIEKTKKEIVNIYLALNGYVASETGGSYNDRLHYEWQIRIPAKDFDKFVQSIELLARIESKNILTQDVTEEYVDVEARLNTKKELENRYLELLEIAKTVEDMLSIESQIGNIRSEIESMEGRLNFLKNQVSFSTFTVSCYEVMAFDFGFTGKFAVALQDGWKNLLIFFVTLSSIWPFLVLAAVGTYFFVRHRRRLSPRM